MFPRVLLPTDFSPHAEKTVRCIGEVPGIGDLLLLHVLDAGVNSAGPARHTVEDRIREAHLRLEGMKKWLVRPGLEVRVLVHERVHDDVAGTILAVAREEKPDLIALGAKGRTLRNLLLGSVSASVLRDAKTGVLLVHDRDLEKGEAFGRYCRSAFGRMLLPLDFSKPSLDLAASLPRLARPGGDAILLHVLGPGLHEADLPVARESAERRLGELAEALGTEGFRPRFLVVNGHPAREILRLATELDVSLLVLSRFGKKDYVQAVGIGRTAGEVAEQAPVPVLVHYPGLHYEVVTRELEPSEFPIAEEVWSHYHQQRTDAKTDRMFATFVDGVPAGVARCRRHPDGLEVDGVFVLEEFRNRGYARRMLEALVPACGAEDLWMHSTIELVPFYREFGFAPIPEEELPRTIRDRYLFAQGDLAEARVQPMQRRGG